MKEGTKKVEVINKNNHIKDEFNRKLNEILKGKKVRKSKAKEG